ncbi:MAG: aldo/keto reductase [Actinomycetota bacterium]|nr:aldo/keto reductase [Actinomycetota bacterium]
MKTQRLGSQGPEISVVGYGSWELGGGIWGPNPPEDQLFDAVHAGLDAGISWIDTAEIYGRGRSESLVGRALQGYPEVMVFTKVAPKGSGTGFAPDQVRKAAEQSLDRVGRDVIDLYQLHWPDDSVPIEDTWSAMAALKAEGLVRYLGVSNFDEDLIRKCEAIEHVDSLQPHFSLLHRDGRDDLFGLCASNGTGIICYGPLAYGLLTGAVDRDTKFAKDDWRSGGTGIGYYRELFAPGVLEKNLDIVEALRPIADRLDVTLAQLALAWVFHQAGVTGAIAGSRSADHIVQNAGAGDVTLESKDLEEIDEILAER